MMNTLADGDATMPACLMRIHIHSSMCGCIASHIDRVCIISFSIGRWLIRPWALGRMRDAMFDISIHVATVLEKK